MTAPAKPQSGLAPACRLEIHEECPGPAVIRVGTAVVERLRCECPCHRQGRQEGTQ